MTLCFMVLIPHAPYKPMLEIICQYVFHPVHLHIGNAVAMGHLTIYAPRCSKLGPNRVPTPGGPVACSNEVWSSESSLTFTTPLLCLLPWCVSPPPSNTPNVPGIFFF